MPRKTNPMKILPLDIETAPTNVYTWSLWPKYIDIKNVKEPGFTLCWAAKWLGERKIMYSGLNTDTEEAMVYKAWELLDEADAVIHYNGTKFDMPILNREFEKWDLPPPSHYHQIDLLKTVRAQFRYESNKLDYVCRMQGIGAKIQHKGMSLWHGCMAGNEKDWKVMEKYNKQDVNLLPKLYQKILPWIPSHPNVGVWLSEKTKRACAHCGSSNLKEVTPTYKSASLEYERFRCNTCETPLRASESLGRPSKNLTKRTPK